jgi:WS/DGAT/MGAT family acyltransferase
MLRQLTDQDAIFLCMETPETPAHVGGLSLVELPAGYRGSFYADYRALIASRMGHVPFMRSRLAALPLDLDRPFWVEAEVDLDEHVRHATLPAPGTQEQLEDLVGRLHAAPLDRRRPLWEYTVVDGLASGQVAIYSKIHHAAMDGLSSQALVSTMYDPSPEVRTLPPAPPASERGGMGALVMGVLAHLARQEIRSITFVPDVVRALAGLLLPDPRTLRWQTLAPAPRSPHTPLNVAVGRERAYAARTLPLADVKRIARLSGSKINDVVLAICAGALRAWLQRRGALPERPLTALVPISMRDPADATVANLNGMFPCSVATDVAEPLERLRAIRAGAAAQRRSFERLAAFPWPDVIAPGLRRLVGRLIALYGTRRAPEWLPLAGNLVISNVPGPPAPLYVAGARIVSMYPISIPFHGTAINITVESYCDRLDFGLTACRRAVPDLATLADGLAASFEELARGLGERTDVRHPTPEPTPPPARDPGVARGGRRARPRAAVEARAPR